MNKVILDANVLYSNFLRGLFFWLEKSKLVELVWSSQIWDEVIRNRPGTDDDRQNFKITIENQIATNFPSSMRSLPLKYDIIGLPDKDDEHVIALARKENVPTVLTFNLRDFPASVVNTVGINCIHPDVFLSGLHVVKKNEVNDTVKIHIKNLTTSKLKKSEYFDMLRKADVKQFADQLEAEDNSGNLFPEVWP